MKKQSYIYLIAAEVDMGSIKKGHLGAQFYDLLNWQTFVVHCGAYWMNIYYETEMTDDRQIDRYTDR